MNVKMKMIGLAMFFCSFTALAGCGGGGCGIGTAGASAPGGDIGAAGASAYQMGGAIQGRALALTGTVSTLAGRSPLIPQDGTGPLARFNSPLAVTSDGTNLYVADTSNHTIRKMVIATGVVTTLAGKAGESGATDGAGAAARFAYPTAIATDGTNVYVAELMNHTVRKVAIATGEVTTLAGSAGQSGATDGPGGVARFNGPQGVTTDGKDLYVSDTGNNTIRKVAIATGVVTTLAGKAGATDIADGTGAAARFNHPSCITTDGTTLYLADSGSGSIRQVTIATAVVTTQTGAGPTTFAPNRAGIATDGTSLYVSDGTGHTIRKMAITTGEVTILAGSAEESGAIDGAGLGARFRYPAGITIDGTNLYVTDTDNNTIRKVAIADAAVTTLAGSPPGTDGTGVAALFDYPSGIATDGTSLYVADAENNTIRKVVIATGAVTTLAGNADASGTTDGTGSAALFDYPVGITTDGTNLYVTETTGNTIRKVVIATGAVTTLAGKARWIGSTDGTGPAALFNAPADITTDGTDLYVADTGNCTIRKIAIATGAVTTLAGSAEACGAADGAGAAARFNYPTGITSDGTSLYVADTNNGTIRKVVIVTGSVTTLAGRAGASGAADGTGAGALFSYPCGITIDGTNLYVADTNNGTIRMVAIATGTVTTLAGSAGGSGATDGTGTGARFAAPSAITTDGTNLYVADTENNTIRSLQ